MRLRDIKTKEEANEFLKSYLPVYNNKKFRVSAANETNVHVKLPRVLTWTNIYASRRDVR